MYAKSCVALGDRFSIYTVEYLKLIQGDECQKRAYWRSADGTCNNIRHPTWGATLAQQTREIPPMYDDGKQFAIPMMLENVV